jgi:hypothetical protein
MKQEKQKSERTDTCLQNKKETNNQLAQKYEGCYEHITEVCDLSQPFLPLIKQLYNVAVTGGASVEVDSK